MIKSRVLPSVALLTGALIINPMLSFIVPNSAQAGSAPFDLNQADIKVKLTELRGAAFQLPAATGHLVPVACGDDCGIDRWAYNDVMNFQCSRGNYVRDADARKVARLAAQEEIDVLAFLEGYFKSCDFDSALEVGCKNP